MLDTRQALEMMMKHGAVFSTVSAGLINALLCGAAVALPPGQMIDVGGRALHVVDSPGTEPAVVLEAGGGGFSRYWLRVETILRELGLRVISYDRAGLGWSDSAPGPYRIEDRAKDLDRLLTALEVAAPVVLVSHSYGGWVAQIFAHRYPRRVAAMVLVDPNSTQFFNRYPDKVARIQADGRKLPKRGWIRIALRLQRRWLMRHTGGKPEDFGPILTDRHQAALGQALTAFDTTLDTLNRSPLPDVPTILISRGRREGGFPWGDEEAESVWRASHATMIEHLSDRRLWIATNASHAVIVDQPEIVVEAVTDLLRSREGREEQRR